MSDKFRKQHIYSDRGVEQVDTLIIFTLKIKYSMLRY